MDTPIQYRIRLRDQPGPNCNWEINRPDLGFVGTGYLFDVLSKSCQNYRKANGIPIGLGFEAELENALHEQYAKDFPNAFITDDPRAPITIRGLSIGDVLHGTKVLASFVAAGRPTVDPQEALRRAAICSGCRFNVQHSKPCGGICGELRDMVMAIVGNRTTQYDSQLHACFICKCFLQAAVWLPLEIQNKGLTEFQRIQFGQVGNCWKREATE